MGKKSAEIILDPVYLQLLSEPVFQALLQELHAIKQAPECIVRLGVT